MNIKNQIKEAISSNQDFAFDYAASSQKEKFGRLAMKFLDSKTY
jgi:hypothetical protein